MNKPVYQKLGYKDHFRYALINAPKNMLQWFKKSSGKTSELHENLIWAITIERDLADVKVCSLNGKWSVLKLVVPLRKLKSISV